MDIYVSFDADNCGRLVGRARLSDDVEQVRKLDQTISAGNEIWKSFAVRVGGSVIEIGGDEGAIEIDASFLGELPEIVEQYEKCVGTTVTVGVGVKLSESSKALVVGKMRGKNQIVLWHPDMQKDINDVQESPKSEEEKISEEYLNKADRSGATQHTSHQVGKTRGAHAGFSGYHKPGSKASSAEPDAAATKETIKAAHVDAPPASDPSGTTGNLHNEFEQMLHQAAQGQEKEDGNNEVSGDVQGENVKQKLVQILAQVKQQLPNLVMLQQTSPDAYQSIMNLVQGVIMLGRQMSGPEDQIQIKPANIQKAEEDLEKAISEIPAGKQIKQPVDAEAAHDYTHVLPQQHQKKFKLLVEHTGTGPVPMINAYLYAKGKKVPVGHVDGFVNHKDAEPHSVEPHSELNKEYHGMGLGTALYEALYSHAKHKLGINRVEGTSHSAQASAVHQRLSTKHGLDYKATLRPANEDKSVAKFPYGKYSYTIKEELAPNLNEDELFGPGKGLDLICDCEHHELTKDELEKGGLGSSGGSEAGRVHENLPVGTVKDGKLKVKHPEGGVSWTHVSSGQVAAQDAGGQPFGANTHPVSSKNPNTR